jgi:hypothetical protein
MVINDEEHSDHQTYDLLRFTMADMTRCGAVLRKLGRDADSMESVANRIVDHLYQGIVDPATGEPCSALVRLFKTHPYAELPKGLQTFASRLGGDDQLDATSTCLTLLATRGAKDEWNSRHNSRGHQAIPLASEEMVHAFPMISNLVSQFGITASDFINPHPQVFVDRHQTNYNVFYEQNVSQSEFIVAQKDFVNPEGVQSCLGFGGMLPSGNFYAVIVFTRAQVAPHVAAMFRTISLSAKVALIPFESKVFSV